MDDITSKQNEKIKFAVKIKNDASFRKKEGLFFLEGLRLCLDALESPIEVLSLFLTGSAILKYGDFLETLQKSSKSVYKISDDIAEKLSDTKNPQGVFCICRLVNKSRSSPKIKKNGLYIALENLQSPDNLGALARSAEALGIDGLIVSGGCGIFNPKALRASMGSLLRFNIMETGDLPLFLEECLSRGMSVYAAVPDRDALSVKEMDRSKGMVAVIGNEGSGLSREVLSLCTSKVTIPMRGRAESLNAAAAAAVIMWEMVR